MDEQDRDRDARGDDTAGHVVKTIGLPPPRESGEPDEGDTEGHGNRPQFRAAGDESDDVEGHGSHMLPRAAGDELDDVEGHGSHMLPRAADEDDTEGQGNRKQPR